MSGPLLITRGALGNALAREARARGWGCVLADREGVARALEHHDPAAVIDGGELALPLPERGSAAAKPPPPGIRAPEREVSARDDAARLCDRAGPSPCPSPRSGKGDARSELAAECARREVKLVIFSSDQVFDGASGRPYFESDPPRPLTAQGEEQAKRESELLGSHSDALVLRTGPRLCPWSSDSFLAKTLTALSRGATARVPCEGVMSPSYVPHLARATLELLRAGQRGIWHLANRGPTTWEALAREAARLAGLPQHGIVTVSADELELTRGPRHSVLVSERGARLPLLHEALVDYVAAWREAAPRLAA